MRKNAKKPNPPKKPRVKKVKPRVSTGKERKEFAVRMLVDNPKPMWQAELRACKDLFNIYPVEFLIKVAKPPFKINSCFFFLSEDGKQYLERKLKEFLYKPQRYEIVEGEEKQGENWNGKRKRGFREFLNN